MRSRKSNHRSSSSNFDFYLLLAITLGAIIWSQYKGYKLQNEADGTIANVCRSTRVNIEQMHNKLCFHLSLPGMSSYPSYAHHRLITVEIENSKFFERFNDSSFVDIQGHYPDTSFCLYTHFPDELRVTTICEFDQIDQQIIHVKDVDLTNNDETNIRVEDSTMFVASDFCVDKNDNVMFTTNNEIISRQILLSDTKSFNLIPKSSIFTSDWPVEDWTTVFVTPPNSVPWLSTISSLLPLWKGNVMVDTGVKIRRFQVRKEDQETYERLVPGYSMLYQDYCYKFGVFPKIQNNKEDIYFEYIYNLTIGYSQDVIQGFRDRLSKSKFNPNLIVVDKYLANDVKKIEEITGFTVAVVDDNMPVHQIADLVHSAKYYICSHLTTGIYGIFLQRQGTLIERKISNAGKFEHVQKLAQLTGCGYAEIGHSEISEEMTLQDYYNMKIEFPDIDYFTEIKGLINHV